MLMRLMRRLTTKGFLTGAVALAVVAGLLIGLGGTVSAKGGHRAARGTGAKGCLAVLATANRFDQAIDGLVTNGTLNAQQAQAVKQALNNAAPRAKACERLALLREAKVGQAVQNLLGMNGQEIRQQFRAGKSLSEMAQAKGIDRQKLIDTITTAIGNELDTLVQNGTITAQRKTELMAQIAPRIQALVDLHKGDLAKQRQATPGATPEASPVATENVVS